MYHSKDHIVDIPAYNIFASNFIFDYMSIISKQNSEYVIGNIDHTINTRQESRGPRMDPRGTPHAFHQI